MQHPCPTIRLSSGETPLLVFQSELAAIEAETLKWPDRETGGELFGYFTYAGWPVVHRVVNANATARRGSATFHPDANQITQKGRELIDNFGLQHLGQWHSHHRLSLTHPSGVDRTTVGEAIRTYGLVSFVQIIANIQSRQDSAGAMAHAYFYREQNPDQCEPMRWLVLPGVSPITAMSAVDVERRPEIQLEPRVVTWAELRNPAPATVLADSEVPITDQAFLKRLQEELQLLDAAGVVARGLPQGRDLRIDATHGNRRFTVFLAPDFPYSPPALRQLFDDAPDIEWELPWTPERRIVDLLLGRASTLAGSKSTHRKRRIMTRALTMIRIKRRQIGSFMSARTGLPRSGR